MRPVATRKRRGASIDFDLDKQPNRRETAKRRSGAGFKRKSACPSRAPGHVLGMFLFQGAWPCLLRRHPGGAPPSFPGAPTATRTGKKGRKMGNLTQQVGLDDKKCATCRWWQGERQISFWAQKPFKVKCESKGNCAASKAPKAYSGACPRWVAWEKLP